MPSLFSIGGYRVFFWSNEGHEPIHVHICKGVPTQSSTKIWLTKQGGCVLANNNSRIPKQTLAELLPIISAQHDFIERRWMEFYCTSSVSYYC